MQQLNVSLKSLFIQRVQIARKVLESDTENGGVLIVFISLAPRLP